VSSTKRRSSWWKGSVVQLLFRALALFVCSAVVAVGLMWMIRAIPFDNAYRHIDQEARVMLREPVYPQVLGRYLTTDALDRDNITDACMLSTMMPDSSRTAFQAALADAHAVGGDDDPHELVAALVQKEAGHPVTSERYAHYWHGYQLLYLPLLEVTSYNGVRIVMAVVLVLELIAVLLLLKKRVGWQVAALFGLSAVAIYGFMVPFSLQFIAVFLIGLAFSIVVLVRKRLVVRSLLLLFFFCGILTVFFDFLTAPFITCGLPLLCYLARRFRESPGNFGRKRTYAAILGASAAWIMGYGLFWVAKWVIASAFLRVNVIQDAMGAIAIRAGSGHTGGIQVFVKALAYVLAVMVPSQLAASVAMRFLIFAAGAFLFTLVWFVLYRRHRRFAAAKNAFPFLLVALLPFVWLLGMAEHTMIHYWFSYRVLMVSSFAVLLFAYYSLNGPPHPEAEPAL